jgi:hypothetical protein
MSSPFTSSIHVAGHVLFLGASLPCCWPKPSHSLFEVSRNYSLTLAILDTKAALRIDVPLIHCSQMPPRCLFEVLKNSFASRVHGTGIELCIGVSLVCCFPGPPRSLAWVPRNSTVWCFEAPSGAWPVCRTELVRSRLRTRRAVHPPLCSGPGSMINDKGPVVFPIFVCFSNSEIRNSAPPAAAAAPWSAGLN